jgi:hypothetical protein
MVHIGVGIAIAASLTLVVAFLGHIGMPPPASGIDLTPEGATGSGSDSGIPA